MEESKNERFYWLKLKKDFFKRHDIKIVEGMENGKDYVLFYLKLLCESLDHSGNLRFSDTIPYNESMLSAITGTNIDIVRSAMKILVELNLVEVLDDKTIYMREVEKMTGSETASTIRSRQCRLKQNEQEMLQCNKMQQDRNIVQQNATQEYRDKSIENRSSSAVYTAQRQLFIKPTLEEVQAYCKERCNSVDAQRFMDFYTSNGWKVGRNPMKDWRAAVRTWEKDRISNTSFANQNTTRQSSKESAFFSRQYSKEELDAFIGDTEDFSRIEL